MHVEASTTIELFISQLRKAYPMIEESLMEVLSGYPPAKLDISSPHALVASLVQSGDSLVVREGAAPASAGPRPAPAVAAPPTAPSTSAPTLPAPASTTPAPSAPALPAPADTRPGQLGDGSAVVRRVVDSDNSCCFNAVGYVMLRSRASAPELRQMCARNVREDRQQWNAGILGSDPDRYAALITEPDRWGGPIELSILAHTFKCELAAFDTLTGRCDLYGEGAGYSHRAMLIYDGIHYDALAVSPAPGAPEDMDITQFGREEEAADRIMAAATALVAAERKKRAYVDTNAFSLRCDVCRQGLTGEREAREHAAATGHASFVEYR